MADIRLFSRGSGRLSRLGLGIGIVASSLLLAACGGSSGPSKEEIAQLRRQGAERVHKEERLRKLEQEVKHIKHHHHGVENVPPRVEPNGSGSTPVPAPSPAQVESCGGELEVNSYTTCPFAENVEHDYYAEIGSGSGSVDAYSPAKDQFYVMYCTASPHECTGGNNAAVYFP